MPILQFRKTRLEMNPIAICADMAFHHPHNMQAFYRMHNAKIIPTGPHTPWPNRAEMGVRLFKKFSLGTGGYSLRILGPDHSGTTHSCSVDPQGSNGEKYTGDLKWPNAHGTGHGTKTKRSLRPSFHESRTAYIHANQAGSLQWGNSKMAMQTHLEIQQREDIPEILLNEWSLFLLTCVQENMCLLARRSEQYPARTEIWRWKSWQSSAPWQLSIQVRPYFRQT